MVSRCKLSYRNELYYPCCLPEGLIHRVGSFVAQEKNLMNKNPSVILYAQRTPIGKMNSLLSSIPAPKLTALLIKDALKKTNITGSSINEIILGNVLTAGIGQAPARQAAIFGDLPKSVSATTIGKVCGSGLKSIMLADQAIRCRDASLIFAGGQENMSLAPHLLPKARFGYKFGGFTAIDSMQHDGLIDPYSETAMGNCAEICAKEFGFSREDQDQYAIESYQRSNRSIQSGHFKKEIVPIELQSRKGTITVDTDEEPLSFNEEKMKSLRPAFEKNGTITAANASSINDGAALTLLSDLESAKKFGIKPLAKIVATANFAQEPTWFTTSPIESIKIALTKASLTVSDIDIFEINEAFSVVPMAAMKSLSIPREKVNPNGGAVSLGHPIGASGARILVSLVNGLNAAQKRYGLASICIGGGEASTVIIERLD